MLEGNSRDNISWSTIFSDEPGHPQNMTLVAWIPFVCAIVNFTGLSFRGLGHFVPLWPKLIDAWPACKAE